MWVLDGERQLLLLARSSTSEGRGLKKCYIVTATRVDLPPSFLVGIPTELTANSDFLAMLWDLVMLILVLDPQIPLTRNRVEIFY